MIAKIAIARWVVVGGVLAAVGVAGAATKLKRPTTGDACLCTPDAQAPNDLTTALEPTAASAFASRGAITPAGSTSKAGPLAAALSGNISEDRRDGAASGGGGGGNGVAWGAGGRYSGAKSASNSGHSATLGGLWRLMSLSRRAPGHSAAAEHSHAEAAHTAQKPKQHPRSGSSGGSGTGPSTTLPAGVTQDSDLFAEDHTSIPDLLDGGGSPKITTPEGKTGGALGAPGSLAATPEPGPLFLVGAGLIAIASLLRRRLA